MKALRTAVIVLAMIVFLLPELCLGWQVRIAWDDFLNNPPDVGGYKVFYRRPALGETTYVPLASFDVGKNLSFLLIGLAADMEYCLAATTYYVDGEESGFSTELCLVQPTVMFIEPDQNTVGGVVSVGIAVTDVRYPVGPHVVSVAVNDSEWTPIAYNSLSGLFETQINTSSYGTTAPETLLLSAVAVNPDGLTSQVQTMTILADNRPRLHIGDLDDVSVNTSGSWTARVRISVHTAQHSPLGEQVTVNGMLTGGVMGVVSCVVGPSNDICILATKVQRRQTIVFQVTGVVSEVSVYNPSGNHDPDGDSNGLVITLKRPGT